jgi:hypothetical protein
VLWHDEPDIDNQRRYQFLGSLSPVRIFPFDSDYRFGQLQCVIRQIIVKR